MKTTSTVFDHDREYGRDIRVAGVVALVSVTVAFLFAPQPKVEPYRLRRPVVSDLIIVDPGPLVYVPPKPPEPIRRGVPVASSNPEVPTIGPNTDFDELKPDITAPVLEDVKFWKVERKPRLLAEVTPAYPEMARAAGIEGRVVYRVLVDKKGNYRKHQLVSSPDGALSYLADSHLKDLEFIPAEQNGEKVTSWVNIPVVFKISPTWAAR